MRKNALFVFASLIGLIVLLAGCSPSDKYTGEWYGLTNDGKEKVKVNFSDDKKMTIKSESGKKESHDFTQTGTGFVNNTSYYKIKVDDKIVYYVIFKNKKDKDNAMIVEPDKDVDDFEDLTGKIVCVMNRNDYPDLSKGKNKAF